MNLSNAQIILRPRMLSEIFDLGLRFYGTLGAKLYAQLAGIVLLPCFLLCVGCYLLWDWHPLSVWALAVALATVSQGFFTLAAARLLFEQRVSLRPVLMAFVRKLMGYALLLAFTRGILVLSAVTVVLAFILWPAMVFVHEAFLLENQPATKAWRRARDLARGPQQTFAFVLISVFIWFLIVITAELLGQGTVHLLLLLDPPWGNLFEQGISLYALLGFFAAVPYLATVRFLVYIDGRTRQDGWDLQLQFMNIVAHNEASRSKEG